MHFLPRDRRWAVLAAALAWVAPVGPAAAAGHGGSASRDASGSPPVGVLSHRAAISIDPLSRVIVCADTMLVSYPPGDADSAYVRLHPAWAPSFFGRAGEEAGHAFRLGTLRWKRDPDSATEEIVIHYRGRLDFPSEFSRVSAERAVLRAEEVLPWGEGPIGSGRLAVSVPADWAVAAPGTRVADAAEDAAGPTRTHAFEWRIPVASVGWICAGRYDPPAGSDGGRTRVYRLSSDAGRDRSRDTAVASLCDSLLEFYGAAFLPYRFDRFDVVEVDEWVGGGAVLAVAAPSFIMVKRSAFSTDDRYNRVEAILPHEVAHQWWMGTVFPAPRAVALLSEGLCEYSAVLYSEEAGGGRGRDSLAGSPLLRPLISKVKRGAAPALDTAADIRAVLTQYLKGAYVHHMLRGAIGDGPYRRTLSRFAEQFDGMTAGIADFRAVAEEASGEDLRWFFDQWVAGKGIPALRVYNARAQRSPDGWLVTGRVRVAGYDRYTATVELEVRTSGAPARTTVDVGLDSTGAYRNDVGFAVTCAGNPASVAVDPDGDLLLLRRLPPKLSDLRDPGSALLVTGGGERAGLFRALAAADSARLVAWGWAVAIIGDDAATLGELQRERVILYGGPGENRIAGEPRLLLPFSVAAGEAVIGDEAVRDSTLGLLQAVANPWLDEGTMIVVQPFGPAARPELRPFDDSWALVREGALIQSGTWPVTDAAMEAPVVRNP